ncbi:MAG: DUF350 domain-containing protein [Bacteroidia bacterium]|nr:DUF350 domain-containing protein [Bacteroidia bacterium]
MAFSFLYPLQVNASAARLLSWEEIVATFLYGLIGIFLMLLGYKLFDWMTPFSLSKQLLEEENIAVAIVVAAILIGIALIVMRVMA